MNEKALLKVDEYLQKGEEEEARGILNRFISAKDYFPADESFTKEAYIEEIIKYRSLKRGLSSITGYNEYEISITTKEALSGGVKYHFGPLAIGNDIPISKVDFPERVSGSLYIDKYDKYADFKNGVVLSRYVDGDLYISKSPSLSGLKLPEKIRNLYIEDLETTVGLRLPVNAKSVRFGYRLKSIEGLVIPEGYIDTYISFSGVNSKFAKKITISENFNGVISFRNKELYYSFKDKLIYTMAILNPANAVIYPIFWFFKQTVKNDAQFKGLFGFDD